MNVFVIGNGESRKGVDLNSLNGRTYGCNALYRDFAPDYLLAIDTNMVIEIFESGYCKEHQCYFSDWDTFPVEMYSNFQQGIGPVIHVGEEGKGKEISIFGEGSGGFDITYIIWINDEKIIPFSNEYFLDTGTNAIKLASEHLPEGGVIYMLGFDMKAGKEGKNNNIYKDTKCYSSSDSEMRNTDKWINEIRTVMKIHPFISYCRVDNTKNLPEEWNDLHNVECISYEEFESNCVV
ncbi:hypothetical protein CMI47_21940 [Candidatus Pacearchaeota archaeon]|nr:hypothetical protein [Candidatus Pacearchaeota archaeon]|tara:strand:- start:10898 stop:11605 length:708 start_codon:yes stop_codon:yes gene_type:complete